MLPGGKAVLFTAHTGTTGFDSANLEVQPLPTGARKVVQRGAFYGRYLPSGHLVYMRDGALFAAPFDLDRLEVTGPRVRVLGGVTTTTTGAALLAMSDAGTLVYLPGRNAEMDVPIEWMNREGKTTPLCAAMPANWSNLVFAPDGRWLAVDVSDGQGAEVWTCEWERGFFSRLELGPGGAQKPVWTNNLPQRIVFGSRRGSTGALNLYWRRADGTGKVEQLTDSKIGYAAWSFDPNDRFLAMHQLTPQAGDDVFILPIKGDEASGWTFGEPYAFADGPGHQRAPMFSPDGQFVAYQSTESGRDEVYVRPFLGPGKWQVSTGGGTSPTWSRMRKELFFAASDNRIMVVAFTVDGDTFRAEKPRVWSGGRFVARPRTGPTRSFDLHPDGDRFALAKAPETQAEAQLDKLVVITNFFDELRRLAPSGK